MKNCRIRCGARGSTTSRFPIRAASRSPPPPWSTGESLSWSISTAMNSLRARGDRPAEEAVSGAQSAGVARRGSALRTGRATSGSCIGGYKYFYIDWNLDIWRCEAWNEPMGSVFDLDHIPDQREPCNACMMACYRKRQYADARRRRGHGCGAGGVRRSNRSRGGGAFPARRGAITLGTDRRDAEDAPLGSPPEANRGQR